MDRLNAMRAHRAAQATQEEGAQPGQAFEMNGLSNGTGTDTAHAFYAEVDAIKAMVRQLSADVKRISELQDRMLQDVGNTNNAQTSGQLDELVEGTRNTSNEIRQRLQQLAAQRPLNAQDARMRNDQIGQLRSRFTEALQNYQQVEQQYRAKYRERVERQFKIVKPDATPEEVKRVVENDDGGGEQIFAKALTNSSADRYREGRARYQEVQERHQEIRKIETTLAELAQLFQDMNNLVLQQDEQINYVETAAENIAQDTEAAAVHMDKAKDSAARARRKRIICFWISLLILIAIGIIVGIVVWQEVDKNKGSSK